MGTKSRILIKKIMNMKTLKYFIVSCLTLLLVWNCQDDDNLDFIKEVNAPSEVSANFLPMLDKNNGNDGLIMITPNAIGAASFNINFGDESEIATGVKQGDAVVHQYAELPEDEFYTVTIEAIGITGLTTVGTKELPVVFKAPELSCDIEEDDIDITNSESISKQVDVKVTAEYGISYAVYFGEPGNDDPKTANNGESVSYQYQEAGTYSIRIVAMSAAMETTECTFDFLVTEILQPVVKSHSEPNREASDVVSIYSGDYTNISLSEVNPNWGQTTVLTEVPIEDDNTWYYTNLNYTGIVTDYGNPTDLSEMTYVHFDYWTPNATKLGLKLVNTVIGEEDIEFVATIERDNWVSVDIALDDFAIDRSGITQLLFDTEGANADVFIDNLYFYKPSQVATTPEYNAPSPTYGAGDVISIFSDSYTSVGISELNPNWGQTTTLTPVDINGNNIWLYEALNFTGIVTDYGNPTNLSGMDYVHFDYFTPDLTPLGLKIVNTVTGQEDIKWVSTVDNPGVRGTWVSVTIPLSDYAIDPSGVTQLIFDTAGGSAKVYVDNLYFYSENGTQPTVEAPLPTIDASDVMSIFSDSYTSVGISELNPNWGQTTTLTPFDIAGNNIWRYDLLNYTGIVTDYGNPTNLSGMQYVHFDYWTPDATVLGLKIVNTVIGEEDIKFVPNVITGTWVSVSIPLGDYNIDPSGVTQLIFDTTGASATVYIDNLYFHN